MDLFRLFRPFPLRDLKSTFSNRDTINKDITNIHIYKENNFAFAKIRNIFHSLYVPVIRRNFLSSFNRLQKTSIFNFFIESYKIKSKAR